MSLYPPESQSFEARNRALRLIPNLDDHSGSISRDLVHDLLRSLSETKIELIQAQHSDVAMIFSDEET